MRTTDKEYVDTTVTLNKNHNEKDNEMVQRTKIILKQTARHNSALFHTVQFVIHLLRSYLKK